VVVVEAVFAAFLLFEARLVIELTFFSCKLSSFSMGDVNGLLLPLVLALLLNLNATLLAAAFLLPKLLWFGVVVVDDDAVETVENVEDVVELDEVDEDKVLAAAVVVGITVGSGDGDGMIRFFVDNSL
jgi:hypothetical protein